MTDLSAILCNLHNLQLNVSTSTTLAVEFGYNVHASEIVRLTSVLE